MSVYTAFQRAMPVINEPIGTASSDPADYEPGPVPDEVSADGAYWTVAMAAEQLAVPPERVRSWLRASPPLFAAGVLSDGQAYYRVADMLERYQGSPVPERVGTDLEKRKGKRRTQAKPGPGTRGRRRKGAA